jgi:uncharacterized protein
VIVNLTRGGVVCERAVVADRALRRMRGLLGRRTLPAGEGMLLRPAPSVHTAFMRFPIDVLFLDKDLVVVKVAAHLRPWRATSASSARAVLELAAGESGARGVEVGDRLELVDRSTTVSVVPAVAVPIMNFGEHGDATVEAVTLGNGDAFWGAFPWR